MSTFDIEQCKTDGGLAIHEQFGEVKIIVFEEDPDGHRVAQRSEDKVYYFVTDVYLTNIPKKEKKKITIYVYEDDGELYATQYLNYGSGIKLRDTIEKEYEI
jgi:hypothetical protein